MTRGSDIFDAHQRARFMRPDAHRWMRPDAARWLTSPPVIARKYSPDQPRDASGRWTELAGNGAETAQENSDKTLVEDILSIASRLSLTGSPADYRKCLNLCYPILERFSSPGSDRNTWDFHKCMNACLGLNR